MFSKYPVVTASFFASVERLRRAVEVHKGQRVQIVDFDFRPSRNCGHILIGQNVHRVAIVSSDVDLLSFGLDGDWLTAVFDGELTKVGLDIKPRHVRNTIAGEFSMRWVGTSFADRYEEPLHLKDALYCAQVRGMSLAELLNSQPEV